MNSHRDQRGKQPTVKKMLRTILLFPFVLLLLLMSLPLMIQLVMDITSIPDRIKGNYVDKKMIAIAQETAPFQVGEEKIYVDTMSIILYGLKELDRIDSKQPLEYKYIGGNEYHVGYYEFGAQLSNFTQTDGKYHEDTAVTDFFNEIIPIINDMNLDYIHSDFPEEYYIGFDEDTIIEHESPDGEIYSLKYGAEAAMSIEFFSAGKVFQGEEDAKTVTFRLLLGNPEDSIEYAVGEKIKESLLRFMDSTDELYHVYDLKNVVPLINSGSWIPPDYFNFHWID